MVHRLMVIIFSADHSFMDDAIIICSILTLMQDSTFLSIFRRHKGRDPISFKGSDQGTAHLFLFQLM